MGSIPLVRFPFDTWNYKLNHNFLQIQLSQVVWNSTFEIGVGSARSSVHGDIVCVRYSPRGANGDPEMYKNNIFPKIGEVVRISTIS